MKTIAYRDKADGSRRLRLYIPKDKNTNLLDKQSRHARIIAGLSDIKGLGNVAVYLIKGRKFRRIFDR